MKTSKITAARTEVAEAAIYGNIPPKKKNETLEPGQFEDDDEFEIPLEDEDLDPLDDLDLDDDDF